MKVKAVVFRFVTLAGLLEMYQLSARFFNPEERVRSYVRSVGICLLSYVTSHSRRPYNRTSQWSDQHLGDPGFKFGHWASQQIFCLCPHRLSLGQLLRVSHGRFFRRVYSSLLAVQSAIGSCVVGPSGSIVK